MLKALNKSPRHCYAKYIDPQRETTQPTPAMQLGTCFHVMLLEPHRESEVLTVVPEGVDRRSKAGKEFFAELEQSGKIPVKHEDYARLKGMVESVILDPVSRVIFQQNGSAELSIFWTEQTHGLRCKIRPDYSVAPCEDWPNGLVIDVKSAADASIEQFSNSAYGLGYHIASALYVDGFQAAYKTKEPPPFLFLAAEKEHPFVSAWYMAPDDWQTLGRLEYQRLIKMYSECKSSNFWPGYATKVRTLELPFRATKRLESLLSMQ